MEGINSIELLTWAMDRALASHSISRINIANANVKEFAPIEISFGQQLQALRDASKTGNIDTRLHSIQQTINQMMEQNTVRLHGESVQVDMEVSKLVKHSGYYQTLADIMSRKMGLMSLAISNR